MQERAMSIEPDLTRRCPAVDPDDHHLFVSPGCAAENLAQAALANGLQATIRFDPEGAGSMRVSLEPTRARSDGANARGVTMTGGTNTRKTCASWQKPPPAPWCRRFS